MGKTIGVGFAIGASVSSSVTAAFGSVNRSIEKTKAAMAAAAKESGVMQKAMAARQKQLAAAEKLRADPGNERLRASLASLTRQYASAMQAARAYGATTVTLASHHARASAAIERNTARLRIHNSIQEASAKRQELAQKAIGVAAGGMAAAAPLRTGIDFEESMSKVKAISGASTEDLAKMTAQARELGGTTVWSAKQAADGMTFLAMAGFNAEQTMATMPGMLSLASAGGTELADTADIASNILTGFGMKAEKMGYVGDVLAKTFTKSNTTLMGLGDAFKFCAPAASQSGQSFQDTAAMLAKLGDAGIQGTLAGTGLNAMLTRMAAPPKEAAKVLGALGVKIKDNNGKMRAMPSILAEISKKTQKLGSADRIAMAKALFGQEHFAKGLILLSAAADDSEKGLKAFSDALFEDGYSARVAKEQTDNLSGDLKGLNSASEEVAIALYDTVKPALREITQWFTTVVQSVGTFVKEHGEIAKVALFAAGGLLAFKTALLVTQAAAWMLKPGLSMLSAVIPSVGRSAATAAAAAGPGGFAGALRTLTSIGPMAFNPMTIGIGAVAGALYLLYQNSETCRKAMDSLIATGKGLAEMDAPEDEDIDEAVDDLEDRLADDSPALPPPSPAKPGEAAPVTPGAQPPTGTPAQAQPTPPPPPVESIPKMYEDAHRKQAEADAAAGRTPAPSGGAGGQGAAGLTQNLNASTALSFNIEGIPPGTFSQNVMQAVQSHRSELEAIVSSIVRDQMRVSYAD